MNIQLQKNLTKIVGYTKTCKELTSNVYSTITNVYGVKILKLLNLPNFRKYL